MPTTKHLRLSIDFHVTIADTPPLLPEGAIEPPDPEYDARQARLLQAVKNHPDVLRQWICGLIAIQMEVHSAYDLSNLIADDNLSLQDLLAPALKALPADDQAYFDEMSRLDMFEECVDMFSESFTIEEDAPVVVEVADVPTHR